MPKLFEYFDKLPKEIRLKIWKTASFIPRNVDIWSKNIYISDAYNEEPKYIPNCLFSKQAPPAILHACSESRIEALKHYTLGFAVKKDLGAYTISSEPRIYINVAVDIVCVPHSRSFIPYEDTDAYDNWVLDTRLDKLIDVLIELGVRRLALDVYDWEPEMRQDGSLNNCFVGNLIPIESEALEEIIYFTDYLQFTHRKNHTSCSPYAEGFRLTDLAPEELKSEDYMISRLLEGSTTIDAYFGEFMNTGEPEHTEKYFALKRRLCKLEK